MSHDSIPPDAGYDREQRFLLSEDETPLFFHAITHHTVPVVEELARPVLYLRTTYLDTPDFLFLRSQGPGSRRLRVREYARALDFSATPTFTGACFLERKESTAQIRTHRRLSIPQQQLTGLFSGSPEGRMQVEARLREMLEPSVVEELCRRRIAPRVVTWFRRRTFTAEQSGVRLALDEQILFALPSALGTPGELARPGPVIGGIPERVLEVKTAGRAPRWLEVLTAGLPRASRLTKYQLAMFARQEGLLQPPHGARGVFNE
ncbi:VTC domain-containing protein [Hyalangium versicolor]|uniref:VTC domain-containing protein n=1 Tax=Hyalangium versicolor TaxID=2861190 RepID=UPI001CCB24A7|nr:VTC domain-containing protein [Hyalangium versicolor]